MDLSTHYPAVLHTSVLREDEALRRQGVQVETLSIYRTPASELLSETDRRAAASTYSVVPSRLAELLDANVAGHSHSAPGVICTHRARTGACKPRYTRAAKGFAPLRGNDAHLAPFSPDGRVHGSGQPHLLCVGRLVHLEGQSLLIAAVAELARRGIDVRLTRVGDGPKRRELEELARAGRQKALADFEIEHSARRLREVLSHVLGEVA